MRKVKRWRYYCEFCKKAGGHAGHMRNHEKHCTMNPDRDCRMCEVVEGDQVKMPKLIQALKAGTSQTVNEEIANGYSYISVIGEPAGLAKLREISCNCPACILAAIRQYPEPINVEFNFKAECKELWSDINQDRHY